jgi:diguanylate cyclase (GGDEF)-like protein
MHTTKEMLKSEIRALKKASTLHAKYSVMQYKNVLKTLEALEKEKAFLEEKVKERTFHLETEIEQKQELTDKLEIVAKYDQLTGLANRYLFLKELKIIQEEANLLNHPFALLFIDLDGFKQINDTYGHEIGDILLQTVAKRIRSVVRKEDMVARLGGDEFTVILRDIDLKTKIEKIATKIIDILKQVMSIESINIHIGSSIGIYIYEVDKNDQDIIAKADIAMYEAKKAGKGKYIFFDNYMQQQLQDSLLIKHKIKNALKNGNFINYYQPIIGSDELKIRGCEVLLRWKDEGDIILPNMFIPILEDDINLIKDVTFWQIEDSIKKMNNFDITFSINLSVKLLNDNDLLKHLKKLEKKYSYDKGRIFFEVTETSLSNNFIVSSKILKEVKSLGYKLSLDDFGTGYSSLAYLREFPFDVMKIDKKFLDNVLESQKDKKLLEAIINMAKILDMKIVLEGIELKEQIDMFTKSKYIKYQGFYFFKPMEYEKLLLIGNS